MILFSQQLLGVCYVYMKDFEKVKSSIIRVELYDYKP